MKENSSVVIWLANVIVVTKVRINTSEWVFLLYGKDRLQNDSFLCLIFR